MTTEKTGKQLNINEKDEDKNKKLIENENPKVRGT